MYIKIEIPELVEYQRGFPDHWLNLIFSGNPTDNYKVNAVLTSYIRLAEGALTEYRQGRSYVFSFWNNHQSFGIGALNLSITYFEACLTNMHRGIRLLNWLRRNPDAPAELKALIAKKRELLRIADRIRIIRNTVQHLENKLLNSSELDSTHPQNTPFALIATGPETPILHEPGQTLKTIDRLRVAKLEILFSELHKWLLEMGDCAEQLCEYQRQS